MLQRSVCFAAPCRCKIHFANGHPTDYQLKIPPHKDHPRPFRISKMSFFYQITLRSLVAKIEERMAKILYRKIAESWYWGKIQLLNSFLLNYFRLTRVVMQPGLGDGTLKWEPNVIVGLWDHSCAMMSGQLYVKPD